MSLSFYIKEFFERNGFVTIPGLGYFELKYRPPVIDRNSIKPPAEKIDFHYNQNIHDNKLALYITEKSKMTVRGALQKVEAFSKEDIWYHLEKFKRFRLDDFGDLIREDNGYIRFEPLAKDSLIYNSFGLETISLESHPNKERRISALWLWFVVPLIIALLGLGIDYSLKNAQNRASESIILSWLSPKPSGDSEISVVDSAKTDEQGEILNRNDLENDFSEEVRTVDSTIEGDFTESEPFEKSGDQGSESVEISPAKSSKTSSEQESKKGVAYKGDGTKVYLYYPVDAFTIVVEECNTLKDARAVSKEMRRQGYSGKVIGKDEHGKYLISILTYSNGDEARKRLANIKNYIATKAYIITR